MLNQLGTMEVKADDAEGGDGEVDAIANTVRCLSPTDYREPAEWLSYGTPPAHFPSVNLSSISAITRDARLATCTPDSPPVGGFQAGSVSH